MAKIKPKALMPLEIYVSIENAGTDEEYFQANKTANGGCEYGVSKVVGHYVLKQILKVEGVAKITSKRTK